MLFTAQSILYRQANKFSKIVLDYIEGATALQPFYAAAPDIEGIKQTIAQKEKQPIDRKTLVTVLEQQYKNVTTPEAVQSNIQQILSENTFTVCTAHQPNLFTGPLYFVYKILHAVKLAAQLQAQLPHYNFIPVYYMGSEDADLEELNHTFVQGKKYTWHTGQKGAVGRMLVDKNVVALIDEMAGQLAVQPFGEEVITLLRNCYTVGKSIQTATFEMVNALFGKYGLVVLIADHEDLKKLMLPVFEEDIFNNTPSAIVAESCAQLSKDYNVQANPRDINLFYLKDDIRERIVRVGEGFLVHNTELTFTEASLKNELHQHPERFSPNVILRGLYQETILPNIAFIGGGGELAYWLQLKNMFQHYKVTYPVLVLRNSFLIVEKRWQQAIQKLGLSDTDIFKNELDIINTIIENEGSRPALDGEVDQLSAVYEHLKNRAAATDVTLLQYVQALQTKALNQVQTLEKKMLRAERKKREATQRQVAQLKQHLFPANGLQERVENFSTYYARWGSGFIDALLAHSFSLEQRFQLLNETF